MHRLSSPFPSLPTSSKKSPRPASDTSTSPPSSRTTSPPSSPTSSHQRNNPIQIHNRNHQNHLFNVSFHEDSHSNNTHHHNQPTSTPKNESRNQRTPPAPSSPPQCSVSILPCAVLRGRSSMMVLRRRPSAVDLALTEERSRCDGDAIERQGLDLMEPRPVDMMNITLNGNASASADGHSPAAGLGVSGEGKTGVQPPRFVMGGIFEVMEGRA